jgi:hypothetical protein
MFLFYFLGKYNNEARFLTNVLQMNGCTRTLAGQWGAKYTIVDILYINITYYIVDHAQYRILS